MLSWCGEILSAHILTRVLLPLADALVHALCVCLRPTMWFTLYRDLWFSYRKSNGHSESEIKLITFIVRNFGEEKFKIFYTQFDTVGYLNFFLSNYGLESIDKGNSINAHAHRMLFKMNNLYYNVHLVPLIGLTSRLISQAYVVGRYLKPYKNCYWWVIISLIAHNLNTK